MSAQNQQLNPFCINVTLGSLATDALVPVVKAPKKMVIQKIELLNGANVAASNTDFVVLNLKAGATLLAQYDSRAAGEGAITANVSAPLGLDGATKVEGHRELALVIAKGTEIQFQYDETDAGSNVALTNASANLIGYFL